MPDKKHIGKKEKFRESFERLYDSHFPILCMYVQRFVADRELCADIVQDSFAMLWRDIEKYDSPKTRLRFLYTASRNTALNQIRHDNVKHSISPLQPEENPIELEIIENEVKGMLWRGIASLPERYAEIISMTLEGYSLHEISEMTGRSLQTVKNNKTIALNTLRDIIEGDYRREWI